MSLQWGDNKRAEGLIWNNNRNAGNPLPVIGTINSPVGAGGSIAIAGENFGAAQGNGRVQFTQGQNSAGSSITLWADEAVTAVAPNIEGSALKYGPSSADLTNDNGDSDTIPIIINPGGARVFVDVVEYDQGAAGVLSFLVGGANRLPVAGDQLAYEAVLYAQGGAAIPGFSILINSDLSYHIVGSGELPNGNYEFRNVRGYDSNLGEWGDTATVSLVIATAEAPVFSGVVPDISVEIGEYFSLDMSEFFQHNPTAYTLTAGTVPEGFTLNPSTGVLAGTSSGLQLHVGIVITGSNGQGQAPTNPFTFESVAASEQAPEFSGTIPNQSGTVGDIVTVDVSGFFSNNPTSYAITSSSLPSLLSISNTGVVSGELLQGETLAGIIITASNSIAGAESNPFSWTVTEQGVNSPPVVTPPADQTIEFLNGAAGLAKNDPALIAAIDTASAVDDSDTVTPVVDLSGLFDPIPPGVHAVPVTSTADSEGLTAQPVTWTLTVSEAPPIVIVPEFSGTIPNQTTQENTVSTLDISSYFENNPTEYTLSIPAIDAGFTISNAGIITAPTTAQVVSGIIVQANNSAGQGGRSNTFSWNIQAVLIAPNAVISGVVDASNNPVTRVYEDYFITDSDINASNKAGQAINVVSSGTALSILNGSVTIPAPGAIIGQSYTLVAWVKGADKNGSLFYFRDVSITIMAGS